MPRDQRASGILRIALPPGVSIAVHVALVALLVVVGSNLTHEPEPERRRVALSEIDRTPASSAPTETEPDDRAQSTADDPGPSARPERATPVNAPSALDRTARALNARSGSAPGTLPGAAGPSVSGSLDELRVASGVRFAGFRTGAAGRIVYCVDASGATATAFTYIRERLLQSIDLLSPTQRFQVVVFRDLGDSGVELAPIGTGLARATRANKDAVADWLGSMPAMGRSNPLDGLGAALALEPDLVLLISRAIERTSDEPWAGGLANVRRTLDGLNPMDPRTGERPVVIKTVQLLDEDPTNIMRAIGTIHGDGADDHSVVRYEALAAPDQTVTTNRPSASLPDRARAVLDELGSGGTLLRASIGAPMRSDLGRIGRVLPDLRRTLREMDASDPSTLMLGAHADLLAQALGEPIGRSHDALKELVLVDPSDDAMRRTLLAQLDAARGDTQRAIGSLVTLIDERGELGVSPERLAPALVTLAALGREHPDTGVLTGADPFVVRAAPDPGWSFMLAWARGVGRARTESHDVYAPLLALRGSALDEDALRSAVVELASIAPDAPRPDTVRLILAHDALGDPERRSGATRAMLELGTLTSDPSVAIEALWIACVGAQADSDPVTLARAAMTLSEIAPQDPRSIDALSGALAARDRRTEDQRADLLERALELGPDRPERDLWALELAQRLSDPARRRALVASLTPETRESDLGAQLVHEDAWSVSFDRGEDGLAHVRSVLSLLETLGSPLAPRWERRAAELEVTFDPERAVERLSGMRPLETRGEYALAQALVNAQRPARATETLTALVATLDEDDALFWDAWALLIETVARHGDPEARAAARAHLTRLSIIDPDLGGSDAARRLTESRRTLHSEP